MNKLYLLLSILKKYVVLTARNNHYTHARGE